jgi:hypothetical protein
VGGAALRGGPERRERASRSPVEPADTRIGAGAGEVASFRCRRLIEVEVQDGLRGGRIEAGRLVEVEGMLEVEFSQTVKRAADRLGFGFTAPRGRAAR